jgi:hypothetical protein
MELIDYVRNAAKSDINDYAEFLRTYISSEKSIHIFYEGYEDPAFYTSAITECGYSKIKLYYHRATNKSNIYKYHKLIDWELYNQNKVLFFTDKDFSDILNENYIEANNIYVTKYYSIENYVVSEEIIERILVNFCRVNNNDLIEKSQKLFTDTYKIFFECILPILSWIVYHKRNGGLTQLNNIDLDNLLYINNDLKLNSKSSTITERRIKYLDRVCQVETTSGSWKEIIKISRELKLYEPKEVIRGKFDIWFLIKFIRKLIVLIDSNSIQTVSLRGDLSIRSALVILSPYVSKPACLKDFIHNHYSFILSLT